MPRHGVAHLVHSLHPGGTERLVIELSRWMRQQVAAVICLDAPGAWAGEVESLGIPVIALHRKPGFQPALGLRIRKIARGLGIGILHCHHYSPFVYGRLAAAGLPALSVVYTEHGRLSDTAPSRKRRWINPWLTRFRGTIHAVSEELRTYMAGEGIAASRVAVIRNGIEPGARPDPREAAEIRSRLGVAPAATALVTVARLDPVKNLAALIDAVSLLEARGERLELWIIGDGPERAGLEAHARLRGVDGCIRFAGRRDDVRRLLPAFDVYVNSSISEGISLTLLEAMAASLPVVATRVGGTPEVVVDGVTGLTAPPRDAAQLALAIERLATSADLRRSMGQAGRLRVEREFSFDRMAGDYARVYRALEAGS